MKKLQSGLWLAILLISTLIFQHCTPKAGDPGPQGEPGSQGAAGPQGSTGAEGPKGDPGTANVQYSPWTTINFTGSGAPYTGSLTAAAVTQDVLDKADIRVYWKESNRVISLPYSQTIGSETYTVHQRFYVGRIDLVASYAITGQQFRYVIIAGSAAIGGRRAAIDYSDYAAVQQTFHIPD